MGDIEMADYVNSQDLEDERKREGVKKRYDTESKVYRVVAISFGLLCILQATLNISLRVFYYSCGEYDHQLSHNIVMPTDDTTDLAQEERNQLNYLRKQKKRLQAGYDRLQTRYDDCSRNLTAGADQRNQFQANYERIETRYDECSRNLTAAADKNQLVERFNALTRERDRLRNDVSKLMNRIKTLENERLTRSTRALRGPEQQHHVCPAGWSLRLSSCYLVSSELNSWEGARLDCLKRGAHLVVINNREEQVVLHNSSDIPVDVWMGLSIRDRMGSWTWVDETQLSTGFWADQQPASGGSSYQDCVYSNQTQPMMASWHNAPCGTSLHWLCEKELM